MDLITPGELLTLPITPGVLIMVMVFVLLQSAILTLLVKNTEKGELPESTQAGTGEVDRDNLPVKNGKKEG